MSDRDIIFKLICLMLPLWLAGRTGATVSIGIIETIHLIVRRTIKVSINDILSKVWVPGFIFVFIGETIQVMLYCCFAMVMAKTDLYIDFFLTVLAKEGAVKFDVHALLVLYITFLMFAFLVNKAISRFLYR